MTLPLDTVHTRLAEAGIAVYGYDHHGHGESEPKEARERALVHDFDHLVSPPAPTCMLNGFSKWHDSLSFQEPTLKGPVTSFIITQIVIQMLSDILAGLFALPCMVLCVTKEEKVHFAHVNGKDLHFLCQQLSLLIQEGHLRSPDLATRLASNVSSQGFMPGV